MSDPFAIFRQSNAKASTSGLSSVATVAGATQDTLTAIAAHTHVTEDVCPQCRNKMQIAYGADNLRFYFCAMHGIAQPIPVNGIPT